MQLFTQIGIILKGVFFAWTLLSGQIDQTARTTNEGKFVELANELEKVRDDKCLAVQVSQMLRCVFEFNKVADDLRKAETDYQRKYYAIAQGDSISLRSIEKEIGEDGERIQAGLSELRAKYGD